METERPSGRPSPARGVALIATAVILGLFVLRNGFEDGSSTEPAEVVAETTVEEEPAVDPDGEPDEGEADPPDAVEGGEEPEAPEGGDESDEPAPPPPPRDPPEVTVRVLNGSGVTGAAGRLTDTLTDVGYQTVEEDNAPERAEITGVLFVEGFDREAGELAERIGAPGDGVAPMPETPLAPPEGEHIVVVLGPDLANAQ